MVKNICTWICADTSLTPVFADNLNLLSGITSAKRPTNARQPAARKPDMKAVAPASASAATVTLDEEKDTPEKLQRRGALMALADFGERFGEGLFQTLPKVWECMTSGFLEAYPDSKHDSLISIEYHRNALSYSRNARERGRYHRSDRHRQFDSHPRRRTSPPPVTAVENGGHFPPGVMCLAKPICRHPANSCEVFRHTLRCLYSGGDAIYCRARYTSHGRLLIGDEQTGCHGTRLPCVTSKFVMKAVTDDYSFRPRPALGYQGTSLCHIPRRPRPWQNERCR